MRKAAVSRLRSSAVIGHFTFCVANGPTLLGLTFDFAGSYMPVFAYDESMLVVLCLLFLQLGPYSYPAPRRVREAPRKCGCNNGGPAWRWRIESGGRPRLPS